MISKHIKIISIIFLLVSTFIYSLLANTNIQDIEVGFSPGEAEKIILLAIKEAKVSIDIAAYSFTSKSITLALINAKNRGIKIRIVADKRSNSKKYTAVTYLTNHLVPVRLNDKYAIMHNKFMIFDSNSIETGSFNYTQSAVTRNAENIIFLRNRMDIVKKYIREFNRLWDESIEIKSYIFNSR
ncbi:MAG: phospholipase D family protein [Arsenophonus sp. ER-EMS1-MAG3]